MHVLSRILLILAWLPFLSTAQQETAVSHTLNEIRIRDPFVLTDHGHYYLYGTEKIPGGPGFNVYRSTDLVHWEGPFPVFRPPAGFWADRQFWAPEVHVYKEKYYLFATYARAYPVRGTQIAVSDSPLGPFTPLGDGPQTPRDWQCLDGTFFVDEAGQPWMVFCHEWTQVGDGEIAAIRLSGDLSVSVGAPIVLFRASSVSWGGESHYDQFTGRVTDGPFLYRAKTGALLMLWSTFNRNSEYCVAVARSENGTLAGPWVQSDTPLLSGDGGHAMMFRNLSGTLLLSRHVPNKKPLERAQFLEVSEENLQPIPPSHP